MFGLGALQRLTARALPGLARRLISTGGRPAASGPSLPNSAGPAPADARRRFAKSLSSQIDNLDARVVGRSVPVTAWGVGPAYGRLNRILMDNNIRRELNRRKRYEKPKYKRQRLRREAHARRFKDEVRKKVHLVYKMKNLGI
ncbi:hypothetical protein LPJ61_004137 [Coemansia biformis]|uniref:Mitochondrial mRNA-processing protein COX24 C-terminal domain-containing protein n=1 Tax=Coemansia biformis TaxID=1286918 RepID=A0A9W7YB79_9FUNG|nr:hypothetical protein LPJ61_004137 [Coemansia biformis]